MLADGYWLPVADGSADICFSSNVLEHVADPGGLIEEMIRATKPGGLIYVSFTNWYSPWGGHEMSPWHLLGASFAVRRYVRRYGRQPKHSVGRNLYRVHVGPVLRLMRSRRDVEILDATPRYYPSWCRFVLRIPMLQGGRYLESAGDRSAERMNSGGHDRTQRQRGRWHALSLSGSTGAVEVAARPLPCSRSACRSARAWQSPAEA